MHAPRRILVTGFGAFPGVPDNPTAALARWLAGAGPRRPSLDLAVDVLPVEWEAGRRRLSELLALHAPDAVLQFGASRRATGFRVEGSARNRASVQLDAAGRRAPSRELHPGAPRVLRAPLPATRLALRLRALGLPAQVSTDCGGYLCNAVYFLALDTARRTGRPGIVQFVHVPAIVAEERAAADRLSWSGLRRGALALIEALAAASGRAAPGNEALTGPRLPGDLVERP